MQQQRHAGGGHAYVAGDYGPRRRPQRIEPTVERDEFEHAIVCHALEPAVETRTRSTHDFIRPPAGSKCTGEQTRTAESPSRNGSRAQSSIPSAECTRATSASAIHCSSAGLYAADVT